MKMYKNYIVTQILLIPYPLPDLRIILVLQTSTCDEIIQPFWPGGFHDETRQAVKQPPPVVLPQVVSSPSVACMPCLKHKDQAWEHTKTHTITTSCKIILQVIMFMHKDIKRFTIYYTTNTSLPLALHGQPGSLRTDQHCHSPHLPCPHQSPCAPTGERSDWVSRNKILKHFYLNNIMRGVSRHLPTFIDLSFELLFFTLYAGAVVTGLLFYVLCFHNMLFSLKKILWTSLQMTCQWTTKQAK